MQHYLPSYKKLGSFLPPAVRSMEHSFPLIFPSTIIIFFLFLSDLPQISIYCEKHLENIFYPISVRNVLFYLFHIPLHRVLSDFLKISYKIYFNKLWNILSVKVNNAILNSFQMLMMVTEWRKEKKKSKLMFAGVNTIFAFYRFLIKIKFVMMP